MALDAPVMYMKHLFAVIVTTTITALLFFVQTAQLQAQGCEHWVAPTPHGDDDNPGTFVRPWATLEHASAHVPDSSCTVWVKDGIYSGENHLVERFATPTIFIAVNAYQAILQNDGMVINLDGARNMTFEGFEVRHTGPGANELVVKVDRADNVWSEHITFRNNIFHDSFNNDLLKIHNGARFITVENNVLYNSGSSEHHMDVNGVTDVTIRDNIFFNDFAGSGRSDPRNTKAFITIKDSNGKADGLEGNERITVRRNVFLNWEGGRETFVQVGNDGKAYHEARDVRIENNLMIGNTSNEVFAAFGVRGSKNVTFTNNTVVGDLPSSAFAFWISRKELNPLNQNIGFYNNIWSDPTGTMGADGSGSANEFSNGDPAHTSNLVLDNNLYWNGGEPIPPGDLVSPLSDDARRIVADPLLNANHASIVLPRWNGTAFLSGERYVRQEFVRLVEEYGKLPPTSLAIGNADPAFAPADDILGRARTATPELGAYEYAILLQGSSDRTDIQLHWTELNEPGVASQSITYHTGPNMMTVISGIPAAARTYKLTNLLPSTLYTVTLTVHDADSGVLAQSNTLTLETAAVNHYLPSIINCCASGAGIGRMIAAAMVASLHNSLQDGRQPSTVCAR